MASAEDIEIAKVVLAGWSIVEAGAHVPRPDHHWRVYHLLDPDGRRRGRNYYSTRYSAACAAWELMQKEPT